MISKDELRALIAQRFEAVGSGNVDAAMAVLIDEPVFDLYPIGLRLSGQQNVRRHYEYFFSHVEPAIVSVESKATLFGDEAAGVELTISWREVKTTHSASMFVVQPVENGKFTGERVYGDERLLRWMFAGAALQPITPDLRSGE